MLVSVGDESDAMVTDMLLNSQDRHIKMDVVVVKGENLRGDDEPQVRHALTLMKEDLGFDVIAKVADAAAKHGFNIQQVRRSGHLALALLAPFVASMCGACLHNVLLQLAWNSLICAAAAGGSSVAFACIRCGQYRAITDGDRAHHRGDRHGEP
jgi:hypothetical protein